MPANLTNPFGESKMNTNREELAWAAGLFEGEGTFSSRGPNKIKDRSLVASIRMVDEDVIRKFQRIVQRGSVRGPSVPKNPNWKPLWTWQVSNFEDTQAVVAMLWDWLCFRRRENIRTQLTNYHTAKPRGPFGRSPKTGRFCIITF